MPDTRIDLEAPVETLAGVGPKTAAALAGAGVCRLADLCAVVPAGYLDRRHPLPPSRAEEGPGAVAGRLGAPRLIRLRGRRSLLLAAVEDDGAAVAVRWHNRPQLMHKLAAGMRVRLAGEIRRARGGGLAIDDPALELLDGGAAEKPPLEAVYPRLAGFGPARVATLVRGALDALSPLAELADPLPADRLAAHSLPAWGEALAAVHRPSGEADVEALRARRTRAWKRLIYGELLERQVALAELRRRRHEVRKPQRYRLDDASRERLLALAPFALTAAQRRALGEIWSDLERPAPMQRLLHGDVGSGKTAVALLALAAALAGGHDAALMVPTELLARQHHAVAERWLGALAAVELCAGGASPAGGDAQRPRLLVGTHALLHDPALPELALVVIDEQHRFGAGQRRRLVERAGSPDLLTMSATPIPRSLAQALAGDLDASLLDESPAGRAPVATEVLPRARRRSIYRRLAADLAAGAQLYAVFPTIDGGRRDDRLSAAAERLERAFAPYPGAPLHGRLAAAEQQRTLDRFAAGELRWLAATTVIEVGVDVPAATRMLIEGAERFGLAQLHQLRGRVARGAEPGLCIALHGRLEEPARRRLDAFAATCDGFELARLDLDQRGAGDLLGLRQAGEEGLRAADLGRDRRWLERAAADAPALAERLAAGELPALAARVEARLEVLGGGLEPSGEGSSLSGPHPLGPPLPAFRPPDLERGKLSDPTPRTSASSPLPGGRRGRAGRGAGGEGRVRETTPSPSKTDRHQGARGGEGPGEGSAS